jgi:hypothetical protein
MKINELSRKTVEILRNQFFSSYQMLETLVDVTPDEIWYGVYGGVPFWYQVYHTVYFVDFWFREDYAAADFLCMRFDARIPPEFEWDVPEGVSLSREEMREYLNSIREKLERVFAAMREDRLIEPLSAGEPAMTPLDVVLSQSRHVMYNIGYCNGILRAHGLPESDWYAYNEPVD